MIISLRTYLFFPLFFSCSISCMELETTTITTSTANSFDPSILPLEIQDLFLKKTIQTAQDSNQLHTLRFVLPQVCKAWNQIIKTEYIIKKFANHSLQLLLKKPKEKKLWDRVRLSIESDNAIFLHHYLTENPKRIDFSIHGNSDYKAIVTPAHAAIACGSAKCCQLLMKFNPNFNIVNGMKRSAPSLLTELDDKQILSIGKIILTSKDIVNAVDGKGYSLLHYAAEKLNVPLIKLLLEKEANVNAQGLDGKTPLHFVTAIYASLQGNGATK